MCELVGGVEIGAQSLRLARQEEFGRVEIGKGATTGNEEYFRDLKAIGGARCKRIT